MEPFPIVAPAFSGESRNVPAANAFDWLKAGWAIFTAAPGVWVVLTLILLIGSGLLNFLPFLGQFASLVLTPMLGAGALQACRNTAQGRGPAVADLFWAFQNRTGPLATLGLIYAVCVTVLIGGAMAIVGGGAFMGALIGGSHGAASAVGIGALAGLTAGLLVLLACVPLFMAIWFAPALVAFNDMAPTAALRASFYACLKNLGATTVFSIVFLLAAFPATLVAGLGWLILLPVIFGALYASYRDVFPAS